jgi:elongation factor P
MISYELPKTVEQTITDTPPGIKGATATNQMKDATTETGLNVKVPPFLNPGDKIRINTENGSYLERVSK